MEEYVTKLTKLSRSCFNESRNSKTTQPRIKNSSFYTIGIVLYYSDVKYQVCRHVFTLKMVKLFNC